MDTPFPKNPRKPKQKRATSKPSKTTPKACANHLSGSGGSQRKKSLAYVDASKIGAQPSPYHRTYQTIRSTPEEKLRALSVFGEAKPTKKRVLKKSAHERSFFATRELTKAFSSGFLNL